MTPELNNLSPEKERGSFAPSLKPLPEGVAKESQRKGEMTIGSPRGTKSLLHNYFPLSFEGAVKESQREVKPLLSNYFPLSFEGEGD